MRALTLEGLGDVCPMDLGHSSWHSVTQESVDSFAALTGDHNWIHVDPVRASNGPFGATVAHGYLTLSILPTMLNEVLMISDMTGRINYGADRIRFTAPIPVGAEVRAAVSLVDVRPKPPGVLYKLAVTVEVKGDAIPAMVGELLFLAF